VVVVSEITAFLDLAQRASGWLETARAGSRRDATRNAARVLHDAGILVAGMRVYQNSYRPVLRRIRLMVPDADADTRSQIIDELERWNSVSEIAPRVEQAYSSLLAERRDPRKPIAPELIDTVLEAAEEFIRRAKLIADVKRNYVFQVRLQDAVRRARSREELQEAAEFAESHLALVDHEVLTVADQAFGRLRRKLAHDYDLPTPDWAA
jgi:hypothetical protein